MIDKIFYINLDRRIDRNINVRSQLTNSGLTNLPIERVSAVDGSKLDRSKLESIVKKESLDNKNKIYGVSLTLGAIGCAMSHRAVWKAINSSTISSALILEDDIEIDERIIEKLQSYEKYIPDFDVLFLGYHPATLKYLNSSNNVNDVVIELAKHDKSRIYGLFGYVVSKKGASKLLKLFPISEQLDTELSKNIKSLDLNIYVLKPNLCLIKSDPSESAFKHGTDIQTNIEPFPTDSVTNDVMYLSVIVILSLLIILFLRIIKLFL